MKRFRLLFTRNTSGTGLLVTAVLMVLVALPSLGATDDKQPIDWLTLLMGLFGGLAMFLYGMEQMSEGLKAAAGKARMAAEVPRQIANARTVFNVANTLLFLGFKTVSMWLWIIDHDRAIGFC